MRWLENENNLINNNNLVEYTELDLTGVSIALDSLGPITDVCLELDSSLGLDAILTRI